MILQIIKKCLFFCLFFVVIFINTNCSSREKEKDRTEKTKVDSVVVENEKSILIDTIQLSFYKKILVNDRLEYLMDKDRNNSGETIYNFKCSVGEQYGDPEFPRIIRIKDSILYLINPFDRDLYLDYFLLESGELLKSVPYDINISTNSNSQLYLNSIFDSISSVIVDWVDYEFYQTNKIDNFNYWLLKDNSRGKLYFYQYDNIKDNSTFITSINYDTEKYFTKRVNLLFSVIDNLIIVQDRLSLNILLYDINIQSTYLGNYLSNSKDFLSFTLSDRILYLSSRNGYIESFSTNKELFKKTYLTSTVEFTNYSNYFFDRNDSKLYLSVFDFKEFALNIYVGDYKE